MTKTARKSIKYLSYSVALVVGLILALFGFQNKDDAGSTVAGNVLGDTAHADHGYAQATYYSQGEYYTQAEYYTQGIYWEPDKSSGDDDGDGDGDGGT